MMEVLVVAWVIDLMLVIVSPEFFIHLPLAIGLWGQLVIGLAVEGVIAGPIAAFVVWSTSRKPPVA
jgi:hypothetical protein